LLLAGTAWLAYDIGRVAQQPLASAFWMEMHPALQKRSDSFHQEPTPPSELRYLRQDWSVPLLPAVLANVGVIENTAVSPVGVYSKDASGKIPGQGAKGRGDPEYRGEVFTVSGVGTATTVRWTPNELAVRVKNGRAGDLLALNLNYDPGWTANGARARNYRNLVAIPLAGGDEHFVFRYRPAPFMRGMVLFLLTTLAIGGVVAFERRQAKKSFTTLGAPA
jgi:hypothetical protein